MSDLRTFNSANDFPSSDVVRPRMETIQPEETIHTLDDNGGLGGFHRSEEDWEEPGSNKGKIIGALVVALMVGTAGVYAYSTWTPTPKDAVADNNLPQTTAPKVAAITPSSAPVTAPAADNAPSADTNTAAPTAPDVVKPMPKQASNPAPAKMARSARTAPLNTEQQSQPAIPQQPAASPENQASAVPEPVSPTPPASALAANPQPAPDAATPSPAPQAAGPAPAQTDGQPEAQAPAPAAPVPAQ